MTSESLLEFPCDFPLKVMGHRTEGFRAAVVEIVERHADSQPAATERESRDGHYVALTFTITATSREQLDRLYRELSAHELVLFAL